MASAADSEEIRGQTGRSQISGNGKRPECPRLSSGASRVRDLAERNSCLVSLATYGNTASPMRVAGVDFMSNLFAKNGESSRPTTAHELVVDPVRRDVVGLRSLCIFHPWLFSFVTPSYQDL